MDTHALAPPPSRARSSRLAAVAGASLGATGVALAALAAHGERLLGDPARASLLRTGAEMQVWHALALLAAAALLPRGGRLAALATGGLFCGILLFATAVDTLAFGIDALEKLAPVGGVVLIASWLVLAVALLRAP